MRQLTYILIFILSIMMCSTARASSNLNEMQYIKTTQLKDTFRIEIGLKRELITYSIKTPTAISSTLLIDFDNTIPGRLTQHKSGKIQLSSTEQVSVKEVQINHTRVQMRLPFMISEDSCRVHTERKPHRLIIEIYKDEPNEPNIDLKGSIVIDAGHGGSDSGAIGAYGVQEKDVTLSVAKKVQRNLQASGANVVMTRTDDRDVAFLGASNGQELQARVDKTPPNAAVFVSIHCNAFSNPTSNGMETYYHWDSAEGQRLATLLNEELAKAGGRMNRGVKGSNFYVLKHAKTAATLVELAFVTNPEEAYLLSDNDYQEKVAMAISRGIARYMKGA